RLVEVERSLAGLLRGDPQIARRRIHARGPRILVGRGLRRLLERMGGTLMVAAFFGRERPAHQRVRSNQIGTVCARGGSSGCNGGGEEKDQKLQGSSRAWTVLRIARISFGSDKRWPPPLSTFS